MYRLAMLGDFPGDAIVLSDFSGLDDKSEPSLMTSLPAWLLFFFTTIIFLVLMMNLLIAIISDNFEKFRLNAQKTTIRERAAFCLQAIQTELLGPPDPHGPWLIISFPKHLASDPPGGRGTIIATSNEEWQGRLSEVNKNVNKALQGHFQKTDTKLGERETQVSMVKKVQEDMAAVQKEMKQAHENKGRRLEEVTLALNDLRAVLEKPSDDAVQAMTSGLAEIKLLMQQSQHLPEPPKETCCAMTSELAEMKLLLQQSQHLTEHPKAEKNAEEVLALLCSKGSGRSDRRSQRRSKKRVDMHTSGDE